LAVYSFGNYPPIGWFRERAVRQAEELILARRATRWAVLGRRANNVWPASRCRFADASGGWIAIKFS